MALQLNENPDTYSIPWARPYLWGDEHQYIQEALASTWISGGPFLEKLEAHFKDCLKVPHTLLVSNGTAALHLAYLALGLGPGDEVILPGFGFLAGANMTLHVGAMPVFAEVDTDTWLVTAREIEPCITSRTKAIVVIHTYGNVCDMNDILSLAKSHKIPVIEDAAEALGSCYENRPAGTMGDIGTFSFQATKTITTGEGGLVATRHQAFAEKMVLYRSHGMQRKVHYWHDLPGHNFRLTNLQAALGYAQAQHWEDIKRERRRISESYTKCLKGVEGIIPQHFPASVDPVVWAVAVRLLPEIFSKSRDQVMEALHAAGIETRPGFFPASAHPYFNTTPLPQCEALSRQIISLPAFIGLDDTRIDYVVKTLVGLRG